MEVVRRASLVDEEVRKMRVLESSAWPSRSKNLEIAGGTTDSVVADEDTNEGVQTTQVIGFREPDPPSC